MSILDGTRVLIAMDGSKYADYAFEWYVENVHRPNNYVILCEAIEFKNISMPMGVGAADLLNDVLDDEKELGTKYLDVLTEKMVAANLHGRVEQVIGPAKTELIHIADKERVNYIVTGNRGKGAVKRTLMGSVSEHILHHSHVPVVICTHKDDHGRHNNQGYEILVEKSDKVTTKLIGEEK